MPHLILGALAYFGIAELGLALATINNSASPVWPATGFAIAWLLHRGPGSAGAIFMGALLANLTTGSPILGAAVIAFGNMGEAIVGRYLVLKISARLGTSSPLAKNINLPTPALLGVAGLAPIVSASIGTLSLVLTSVIPGSAVPETWITWWIGDALGAVLFLPIFFSALLRIDSPAEGTFLSQLKSQAAALRLVSFRFWISIFAILTLCQLGLWIIFASPLGGPFVFLVFPMLLISQRFLNTTWMQIILLTIVFWAVLGTFQHLGPFTQGRTNDNLIALEIFLFAVGMTAITLSTLGRQILNPMLNLLFLTGWLFCGMVFYSFFQSRHRVDMAQFNSLIQTTENALRFALQTRGNLDPNGQIPFPNVPQSGAERKEVEGWLEKMTPLFTEQLKISIRKNESPESKTELLDSKLIRQDQLLKTSSLSFQGESLPIAWSKGPQFVSAQDVTLSWLGVFGALLTLVIASLYLKVIEHNSTAQELVRLKTREVSNWDNLWRTLVDAAPIGIYQVSNQGHFSFVNAKWLEMTGLTAAQASGRGWLRIIFPQDRRKVLEQLKKLLAENSLMNLEFRIRTPTGDIRWINSNMTKIPSKEGTSGEFLGIDLDVSERIRQQTIIEEERLRLTQSSKMASLGEMAAGMAHEINNPLMIIQAKVDFLKNACQQGPLDREKVRSELIKIELASDRIIKIIKGLKTFSRQSEGDPISQVSLRQILDETLDLCREKFHHGDIELRLLRSSPDGEAAQFLMDGYGAQLSQVLLNLLSNSYDSIEKLSEKWIEIELVETEHRLKIFVTDSGNGIPRSIAEKMMQPFFTTKEVGKGTGLGLSISRGILESHQGHLIYDPTCPNTRFIIDLPKKRKKEDAQALSSKIKPPSSSDEKMNPVTKKIA